MKITPPSDDAALRQGPVERPRPLEPAGQVNPLRRVAPREQPPHERRPSHQDDWLTLGGEEEPPAAPPAEPVAEEPEPTAPGHIDVTV